MKGRRGVLSPKETVCFQFSELDNEKLNGTIKRISWHLRTDGRNLHRDIEGLLIGVGVHIPHARADSEMETLLHT
jgi:hypothetical protein